MMRELKILAFLLLALSVGGMAAAPSALAGMFHLSAESTNLTGEALEAQVFKPTPEENSYASCSALSAVESTVTGKTVEEITIKPQYGECGLYEGEKKLSNATVEVTSCAYRLTAATSEEHAKMRVECPNAGEKIHIKATALKLECLSIPPQEVLGTHYQTTGETTEFEQKTLDATWTLSGIVITTVNSVACPTESGEDDAHNNGTYSGAFNLKGDNTIGEPTDVSYG